MENTLKPNFFCVGSAKCGTTTLHDMLMKHPDVLLPNPKETNYFSSERKEGVWNYFHLFFEKYDQQKIIGEFCPSYVKLPALQRIKANAADNTKVLYILRNPVNRAYSGYNMRRSEGFFHDQTFEQVVKEEISIIEKNNIVPKSFKKTQVIPEFIRFSLYYENLKNCYKVFGKENVKVLIFEEFFGDHIESNIINLLQWLGIDSNKDFLDKIKNTHTNIRVEPRLWYVAYFCYRWKARLKRGNRIEKTLLKILPQKVTSDLLNNSVKFLEKIKKCNTKSANKMTNTKLYPATRQLLMEKYFDEDIEKLEMLLNKDLSVWKKY